jgi:hypothetical protein
LSILKFQNRIIWRFLYMTGPALGAKGWYEYISDNTTTYGVLSRAVNETAMGNTATTVNAFPALPRALKRRHVWAISSTGVRRKFYAGDPANTKYLGGGSLGTVDGVTWTVTGRVGEKDFGNVTS